MVYRSVNKTVYSVKCQLVWRLRYRRWVLGGRVEERLKEILGQVAAEVGAEIVEVEVMPEPLEVACRYVETRKRVA